MAMMTMMIMPVCKHCLIFFFLSLPWYEAVKKLVFSSRDRWGLQREDIELRFFFAQQITIMYILFAFKAVISLSVLMWWFFFYLLPYKAHRTM